MKKTRFFLFRRSFFLLVMCLAWLLLLNEAVSVNLLRLRERQGEQESGADEKKALEEDKPAIAQKERIQEEPPALKAEAEGPSESQELMIRVLLTNSQGEGYIHPEVSLLCQGKEYTVGADSGQLKDGALTFQGGEEGITLLSSDRQEGCPVYGGSLILEKRGNGITVINEISLEEYLKGVVPSEMPASYHGEALKAQAVCARTYALRQMLEDSLGEYGAHVDDSVRYQVYGSLAPREETSRAVEETRGQVLTQDGEPIWAYYFSTSSGMTSTDEVWGAKEAASYLKSVPCSFDEDEPFRSWSVTIPWERLEEKARLLTGKEGALLWVSVVKMSQSGAALSLEVAGEGASSQVNGEYEIRSFLSPEGLSIQWGNGESTGGGALLPSAYFDMEAEPGVQIRLWGRGYGHGVGMSQTAANEMAGRGYTFQEILDYFYRDVALEDAGKVYRALRQGR